MKYKINLTVETRLYNLKVLWTGHNKSTPNLGRPLLCYLCQIFTNFSNWTQSRRVWMCMILYYHKILFCSSLTLYAPTFFCSWRLKDKKYLALLQIWNLIKNSLNRTLEKYLRKIFKKLSLFHFLQVLPYCQYKHWGNIHALLRR